MIPAPTQARRTAGKKVKPPTKHGVASDALTDTFNRLAIAIEEIQKKNASKLSFEEHYRYAYTLVLHRKAEQLYKGLNDLVNAHLEREAKQRIEPVFPTSSLLSASAANATASSSSSHAVNGSGAAAPAAGAPATGGNRLASSMEGENFLEAVKATWEDHKLCMGKLRDVLKYMDKVHTEPKSLAPTYTLGLHLFLTTLLRNPSIPIRDTLLSVSLALIQIERDGETVNRHLLRNITDMLCELREVSSEGRQSEGESVYKSWWEEAFLNSTRSYYTAEAERNVETCSAAEFLLRIERRLAEENDRIATYLHPSTQLLLFSLLDNVLIQNNLQNIITHPETGLHHMLKEDKTADLSRMYKLFSRVGDGHIHLQKGIKVWLVEQGSKIAELSASGGMSSARATTNGAGDEDGDENASSTAKKDLKGKGKAKASDGTEAAEGGEKSRAAAAPGAGNAAALDWVSAVLELKDKMDKLLVEAFEKDRKFGNAINDAFVTFVNNVKKAPEYISIFLDENLKKGLKGKNEAEVDAVLDKTIVLFRFLNDKDIFEDYYKRHLAKRLYFQRSVSDDAERGMLAKLKLECGAQFVSKLEGMLKDVGFSKELNTEYKRYLEGLGSEKPSTELSVQVCTSSFWPTTPEVPCILPQEFMKWTKSFERFFGTKYTGRKLVWHAEHGSVDMKIKFRSSSKDVNIATHGAIVLLCFEARKPGETLSYADLLAITGLPEPHLKRTLQSLACAKYKLLKKDPATRNVTNTDKFAFNESFSAPLARIKVQTIANKVESVAESTETTERLDKERSQIVDAAIVRIMKNRKVLNHSELVNEVTSQLSRRFNPKVSMIKMSVERLIEKDYLERNDKDRKILHYLA